MNKLAIGCQKKIFFSAPTPFAPAAFGFVLNHSESEVVFVLPEAYSSQYKNELVQIYTRVENCILFPSSKPSELSGLAQTIVF